MNKLITGIIIWLMLGVASLRTGITLYPETPVPLTMAVFVVMTGPLVLTAESIIYVFKKSPCVANCKEVK